MAPKKVYWMNALSKYNKGKIFCHYPKGTPEHAEVKKVFEKMKAAAAIPKTHMKQIVGKTKKIASLPSRLKRVADKDKDIELERQHQINVARVRAMMRMAKLQRLKG
jgi:hypothetical protein